MKSYLPGIGVISIILLLFILSCATSNRTGQNRNVGDTLSTVDVNNPSITLADYLKRISGVNVFRSGGNTKVMIRGAISMHGNTSPLFVVDGVRYGRDFSRIESIPVSTIQSVRALKGVEASSAYGMEGAAGVIIITTKKN